jgi:parallel beta-helix repeat protein
LVTDLYVSLTGAAGNSGGIDAPLPSLDAARERLRQIPGGHTVTVWIHGGVYSVGDGISFTKSDRDNVVYRALPGQQPALDAGLPVTGFGQTIIDNVKVWAALVPELSARSLASPALALYDEAGALPLNRYPSDGYLEADRVELRDAASKLRYGEEGELSSVNSFSAFYAGDDLLKSPFNPAALPDMGSVIVRVLHLWKDETAYLRGFDPETGKITLARPTSLTIWPGDQYYFENVREGLKTPGSWYLDREAGVLYVVPKPEWDISTLTLKAGVIERMVTLDGVSNITFKGITFTHTGWSVPDSADFPQAAYDVEAAVFASNSKFLSFEDCVFRDLGGTALKLYQGVTDSSVTRSVFERVGANGVFIHGINLRDDPRRDERITVADNEIHDYGVNYRNAVGVLLAHAADCEISHNTIHDGAYTAVSVGWVWGGGYNATRGITIADNLIYNIGSGSLSDMGGIYLLGRQPGTVVSGNVIHDVRYAENDGYGGWGIYLDEGSSEILVANNLVYNCASQGLFVHKGNGNTAVSNIFANNKRGQVAVSRKQTEAGVTLSGNILYGEGKAMFADTPAGRILQSGPNVYWDPNSRARLRTLLEAFGFADAAVVSNPMLANPAKADFTLAEDSPAYGAGFAPFDWSGAGAR